MKRGFLLIEVLIAVFLVVACAMIVGATMPISGASQGRASDLTKAMNLAQAQLEAVRASGYPALDAQDLFSKGLIDSTTPLTTNTYAFSNKGSKTLETPANVLPAGSGTVRIDQPSADIRQITVTISWIDRAKVRSAQVATLVANL